MIDIKKRISKGLFAIKSVNWNKYKYIQRNINCREIII
jgi:hypothetical protein